MTKQILAFLFCFKRELTLYSPLTYSLTSARELKLTLYSPLTYSLTSANTLNPLYSPLTSLRNQPFNPSVCPGR